jgi:hypothetical protein
MPDAIIRKPFAINQVHSEKVRAIRARQLIGKFEDEQTDDTSSMPLANHNPQRGDLSQIRAARAETIPARDHRFTPSLRPDDQFRFARNESETLKPYSSTIRLITASSTSLKNWIP